MKNNFKTKEEAIAYKEKHCLYARVPEYIKCMDKWSLVFPIKATLQVVEHNHNAE